MLARGIAAVVTTAGLLAACGVPDLGGPGPWDGVIYTAGGGGSAGAATGGADGGGRVAERSYSLACERTDDCAHFPGTTVCDPEAGRCVECLPGEEDACGTEAYCGDDNKCVLGCTADQDCPTESCDLVTHRCTGCSEDADCPLGTMCDTDTGICTPGCTSARRCPTGWTCCDGQCANLLTSDDHCNACGEPCNRFWRALTSCVNGECLVDKCEDGYDDCDDNPDNGCETRIDNNTDDCGECGNRCSAGEVCNNGVCGLDCEAQNRLSRGDYFADCDGNPGNGCETNTLTDLSNCGGCNADCELANATPECVGGQCVIAGCDGDYRDCDQIPENGCEVDTLTNVDHCGACQRPCSANQGIPTCANGRCSFECNAGFEDCDQNGSNGCETDLGTDVNNCGGCLNICINDHGNTSCQQAECVPDCASRYEDCNGNPRDGCETDLNTDPDNCGGCGVTCALPDAITACQDGWCFVFPCEPGYADCNGVPGDGCETDTSSDVNHCGQCGNDCGAGSCVGGVCQ